MKILHFSDPHAGGGAEDWMAYIDKRWVGVFNYTFRRQYQHDLSLLENAVDYILKSKADVAVCTGDLTSAGQPGEFEKVRKILQPLRDSSIPLIYMPGNHDYYVKRKSCVNAMKDMVEYLSKGNYNFSDLPAVRQHGDVDFLLLNCSRPSNLLCSWGFVSKNDSRYIENVCKEKKERPRILVSHYPMIEKMALLRTRHRLFGQKKILKLIENKDIDLVLCGHVHKAKYPENETGRGQCISGSVTKNGTMVEIEYFKDKDIFEYKAISLG